MVLPAAAHEPDADASLTKWLDAYDAAFNAKDLTRLAAFYTADVTIFEGGTTNNGWVDYRDNHIGPELEELQDLKFSHRNVVPHFLDKDQNVAYVTSEYALRARVKGQDIAAQGLETLIVVKGDNGPWRISHSHTSSQRH